jgi:hypothetical protein
MKIREILDETTSGGIAVVAQPLGGMVARSDATIYKKKKVKKRKPKDN